MIYLLVMTRILCLPMYDFEIRIKYAANTDETST